MKSLVNFITGASKAIVAPLTAGGVSAATMLGHHDWMPILYTAGVTAVAVYVVPNFKLFSQDEE